MLDCIGIGGMTEERVERRPTKVSWTPADLEKLNKLLDDGASAVRAAAALKRKTTAVRMKARELGKSFPTVRATRKKLNPEDQGGRWRPR
jgi:hypothetical protein